MNILLVGSGGREHALAWKIAQSPLVGRLVAAPGSAGMAAQCEVRNVKVTDVAALVALAREIAADLVVIGPESAVEAGLADALAEAKIPCFGPTAQAGQLETSKAFTKAFADRHGLPTAAYQVFEDAALAKAALADFEAPYVIKADGLAAGKGVVIAQDTAEAEAAIDDALGGRFGAAGARIVIEEFLEGEIGSLFALCDGETSMVFGWAQDHKRAFDGEQGPNTGGMGTYSPAPFLSDDELQKVGQAILDPWLKGCQKEGIDFHGIIYPGVMLTKNGPKVIEFNARFGDPETQVYLTRLESDLVDILEASVDGTLDRAAMEWSSQAAVCVVMASGGYPGNYPKGKVIRGLEKANALPNTKVFHAGTAMKDGQIVTNGGRVLGVTAWAPTLKEAREAAYRAVALIEFEGAHFRQDIASKALR
jgi:phosphoribosylamine--glycine ligase